MPCIFWFMNHDCIGSLGSIPNEPKRPSLSSGPLGEGVPGPHSPLLPRGGSMPSLSSGPLGGVQALTLLWSLQGGSRSSLSSGPSGGIQVLTLLWSLKGGVQVLTLLWSLRGVSHVTYPIMLLYTTKECPSASWAKFTWDPPPPPQSWMDRLTDKHDWKHYLPAHYVCGW